jgi:hypothetical protein
MKNKIALLMGLMTVFGLLPAAMSSDVTVSADVSCYKTMTFNYASVSYGPVSTGDTDVPAPDQLSGVYNVTADTNCNYAVSASGTNFNDGGGHSFDISNLKMDAVNDSSGLVVGAASVLSGSPSVIETGFTPSDTVNYHGFWLSIPASQFGAPYSSTVTITYANV